MVTFIGLALKRDPQRARRTRGGTKSSCRELRDDFREYERTGRISEDTLVERKDQGRTKTEEPDRSFEHHERKPHVKNRNPEQHDIDTCEKQRGIDCAEHQHNVSR